MILVIIICGILYLFMIYGVIYLYYTYHKDYEELEKRNLQFEKRIEEFKKDYKGIYIPINEEMSILIPLIEKDKFDMKKVDYYFSKYGYPNLKVKKNNTSKEGDNMACKKGRGGRKK